MKPILLDLPTPIITPRLIIRPPQIGEGVVLNKAILENFDEVRHSMSWLEEKPPSIDDSEEFVRRAVANWILKNNAMPYLQLFIFDKTNNTYIGGAVYHHFNWEVPHIEIGYWIRKVYSGKGLMTEAVNALTQYAFKQLGVKRIAIDCEADNIPSKKIPERLKYTLEGVLKSYQRKLVTGEITDFLIYAKYDLKGLPDLDVTWGKNK